MGAMKAVYIEVCEMCNLDIEDPDEAENSFDIVGEAMSKVKTETPGTELLPQFCRIHIYATQIAAHIWRDGA